MPVGVSMAAAAELLLCHCAQNENQSTIRMRKEKCLKEKYVSFGTCEMSSARLRSEIRIQVCTEMANKRQKRTANKFKIYTLNFYSNRCATESRVCVCAKNGEHDAYGTWAIQTPKECATNLVHCFLFFNFYFSSAIPSRALPHFGRFNACRPSAYSRLESVSASKSKPH